MSDGTKVNDTPTPDVVVLVWGGRCQQCGLTYPGDGEDPVIRAHVKSEWVKAGLGHLVQDAWPRRFPAWLVREGFRCPVCAAPDMLVDLGAPEDLRVRISGAQEAKTLWQAPGGTA